jgi:hypothetical protein
MEAISSQTIEEYLTARAREVNEGLESLVPS